MNSHCLCGDHLFQKMYWKCLECRSHCKGGFCKNTVTKVYMMIQWWYLIHLHHTCTKHFCSFGEYLVTLFWPQIPGPTCWLYHPPLSAQVCRAWLVRAVEFGCLKNIRMTSMMGAGFTMFYLCVWLIFGGWEMFEVNVSLEICSRQKIPTCVYIAVQE